MFLLKVSLMLFLTLALPGQGYPVTKGIPSANKHPLLGWFPSPKHPTSSGDLCKAGPLLPDLCALS